MLNQIIIPKAPNFYDKKAFFGPETCQIIDFSSPITALFCRMTEWREEINHPRHVNLEDLQDLFDYVVKAKLSKLKSKKEIDKKTIEEFLLYTVGGCEWYFRPFNPKKEDLRKAITHHLATPRSFPSGLGLAFPDRLQTPDVSPLIDKYVVKRLMGSKAAGQLWYFRIDEIDKTVRDFDCHFLASTLHPLKPRRGPYPWLAPWVAATVIYQFLGEKGPEENNKRQMGSLLNLIVVALNGKEVHNSRFYRQQERIEQHIFKFLKEKESEFLKQKEREGEKWSGKNVWNEKNVAELFQRRFENFRQYESIGELLGYRKLKYQKSKDLFNPHSFISPWRWMDHIFLGLLEKEQTQESPREGS